MLRISAVQRARWAGRAVRLLVRLLAMLLAALWSSALMAQARLSPMPRVATSPPLPPLQVLHWWTSSSESRAAQVLMDTLRTEKIVWQDVAIPGGAGVGADRVLKSRVLAGQAPEVTQLIGVNIGEWAQLGLLLQLDALASKGQWQAQMYPAVWQLLQYQRHVVAAPLGIHRTNTLFYQRALFARLGLHAPTTWAEFERVAQTLQKAGVVPLAQSSEPWQVATLFENLLLAQGGPGFYRAVLVQHQPAAFADARLAQALLRLRQLKQWMAQPVPEQSWTDSARQLADGRAGMLISGDWVKAELHAQGKLSDQDFGCRAAPDTGAWHLYSVDTLAMLNGNQAAAAAQEKMAALLVQDATQIAYNQVKGSIPVLQRIDPLGMDSCARDSARVFARGSQFQAPSLVHRMATDDTTREALIAELQRFFMDERISVAQVLSQLQAIARASRNGKTASQPLPAKENK